MRIKSRDGDAIEVTKSTTLHCDYYLENLEEQLYSVLWYWTPTSQRDNDIDFRLWGKSGLRSRPEQPQGRVQFFRYLKIDPEDSRKKAWDHALRGIFDVNVRNLAKFTLQFMNNRMR